MLTQTQTHPLHMCGNQADADVVGISVDEDLNTCIVNSCTNSCLSLQGFMGIY